LQIIDASDKEWIAKFHVFEGTEEVETTEVRIPIPESYDEIMDFNAVTCYDGTIALQINSMDYEDYSSITSFYQMDAKGNVLSGPFRVPEKLDFFPAGNGVKGILINSGALGAPDLENELKLEIYTIDFENEPVSRTINANKFMSGVHALDEESYVVIQDSEEGYTAGIYNNKDELIKSIDLPDNIKGRVCAAVKAGENLAVLHGA